MKDMFKINTGQIYSLINYEELHKVAVKAATDKENQKLAKEAAANAQKLAIKVNADIYWHQTHAVVVDKETVELAHEIALKIGNQFYLNKNKEKKTKDTIRKNTQHTQKPRQQKSEGSSFWETAKNIAIIAAGVAVAAAVVFVVISRSDEIKSIDVSFVGMGASFKFD